MKVRLGCHLVLWIFWSATSFGQVNDGPGIIVGQVIQSGDHHEMDLVHVHIDPSDQTSVTDTSGIFRFEDLEPGYYSLSLSSLGYVPIRRDSIWIGEGEVKEMSFEMDIATLDADAVVITASRKAQTVALAPAAVAMITAEKIASRNLQTFDQAFDELTGVQVTRSSGGSIQAVSIRGASEVAGGGIGNRVLLLLDGRPILSPDSGGALWNLVPLQSIGRIEVVKGAYSSLFGSSAMGGSNQRHYQISNEKACYYWPHEWRLLWSCS